MFLEYHIFTKNTTKILKLSKKTERIKGAKKLKELHISFLFS